jgi:transcription termination factor Rho
LTETGSKWTKLFSEEFKGTGNMEPPDRKIANRRIFPADLTSSSTRRDVIIVRRSNLKTHVDFT